MSASRTGLSLARSLYFDVAKPLFTEFIPDLLPSMAFGLVGEGSECFGYDDDISRDHDWGPAFCLWLPQELLSEHSLRIENVLTSLPRTFGGYEVRMRPELRMGRVGPISIESFYARFLNVPRALETIAEWRRVPETYLAVATNGEVFEDNLGAFSEIREKLLQFYPEDIRLKKIAARCMSIAQAGQYNLPRMLKRYDLTAVNICRSRFCEDVISLVFLLNKRYVPFYKWSSKAVRSLPLLGASVGNALDRLSCLSPLDNELEDFMNIIEDLCQDLADALVEQGLLDNNDPWLYAQGPVVQARIQDPTLRRIPVQFD